MSNEIIVSILVEKAAKYAKACHNDTNHKYDGKSYETHLEMVYDFGARFIHLLLDSRFNDSVLAACWTHDVIEDCRQTYNDVKKATNYVVADITFALTNEKGKNRSERANEKYYRGISENPLALYVKLCDRLANIRYSTLVKSRMIDVYRKENDHFKDSLYDPIYKELFDAIDIALS